MLTRIAIRDVVLIERLDLAFGPGLTVLTGETGAGKSILLDSLGLALGARADSGLVRAGQTQASVAAAFSIPEDHPARAVLTEQGIEGEDELVLRRVVTADGRSRAFANDQPVGLVLLRRLGALLVEVQGQHEQVGLADPGAHAGLLDASGALDRLRGTVGGAHRAWREAERTLATAREEIAAAQRDEEFLRHAVAELEELAPAEGEEDGLAAERQKLQQGERRSEAIAEALSAMTPRDRRAATRPARCVRPSARWNACPPPTPRPSRRWTRSAGRSTRWPMRRPRWNAWRTRPGPTRGGWRWSRSGCSRCAPPPASTWCRWWSCRRCWRR
jgi:DNA repair protein RecN (Recombination protein N)